MIYGRKMDQNYKGLTPNIAPWAAIWGPRAALSGRPRWTATRTPSGIL